MHDFSVIYHSFNTFVEQIYPDTTRPQFPVKSTINIKIKERKSCRPASFSGSYGPEFTQYVSSQYTE